MINKIDGIASIWNLTTASYVHESMAGLFPFPLVVVTKLSSGQRVGRRGGLGGDTGVGGTYPITLWSSLNNAIKWTLFARLTFFSTQSRPFSLVLTCTDTLQLPPALHAFRASPLPGFYPTFHGMDAINDPSCFGWIQHLRRKHHVKWQSLQKQDHQRWISTVDKLQVLWQMDRLMANG